MQLINIGELIKNLTVDTKKAYPNKMWGSLQKLRNIAAHKYEVINPNFVWTTVEVGLPEFEDFINEILEKY
jgi:uncharacterized protein with HEPN domain